MEQIISISLNVFENFIYEFYCILKLPRNRKRSVMAYIVKFGLQSMHWELHLKN